jgi:hypothetical protein
VALAWVRVRYLSRREGLGQGRAVGRAQGVAPGGVTVTSPQQFVEYSLYCGGQVKERCLADVTVAPAWAHGEERQGVAPASGCVRSASGW